MLSQSAANMDEKFYGIAGIIVGALIPGGFSFFSNRGKLQFDDATSIRKELREEVSKLRTEIDKWRNDYYSLRDEHMALNVKYISQKQDYDELHAKFSTMQCSLSEVKASVATNSV